MNDLLTKLGEAIRRRRKSQGMTLAVLSERSGVTLGYISQIETGKNAPSLPTLKRLADAVGCPMAMLVREAEVVETSDYSEQGVG